MRAVVLVLATLTACSAPPARTPAGTVSEPPYVTCLPAPPKAPFPVQVTQLKAREEALDAALADCRARVQQMARDWPRAHLRANRR
jgi:hypothetical protein